MNNTASYRERGASLYVAIVVMVMILGIAFGLSSFFLTQLKLVRGIGESVIAFYAADAGIEREMFEDNPVGTVYTGALSNGASYDVEVFDDSAPTCAMSPCIEVVGSYKQARRAIFVEF